MQHPVLQREALGLLRSPWSLFGQIVAAVLLCTLLILRWPSDARADMSGTQAQQVFRLFGYGFLTIILVLLPAFPATSIVRERNRGTLELLLHTPLSPWSIYFGKLAGSLAFTTLLLTASLPAAAACHALGGVSLRGQIIPLYGVLLLLVIEVVALGLFVSSFARSAESSLRLTYGLVLCISVFTLGPHQFLLGQSPGRLVTCAEWTRCLSPVPPVMEIVHHADAGGLGLKTLRGTPVRFAWLAAAGILICALATVRRLRPDCLERPRSAGAITDDQSSRTRLLRRLLYLVDPQSRSGLMGAWANPVMVNEFRRRRFGRAQWLVRLMAVCAMASLGLTYAATSGALDWGVETIGGIMVLLQFSLISLLVPALGAVLLSGERESGGWMLLQMTPLSAWQILCGKLLGAGWTLVLILVATVPGYLVMIWIQPEWTQKIIRVIVSLGLTGAMALIFSAAVGSLFARTASATVACYAILLTGWGGSLLIWLGREVTFGHSTVEAVLRINPLAAALNILGVADFDQYRLLPYHWWFSAGVCACCLAQLGHTTGRLKRPR